jgi:hypothetical protein
MLHEARETDVTFMVLPGNLPVAFTGHNVCHADERQLQRVGIQTLGQSRAHDSRSRRRTR